MEAKRASMKKVIFWDAGPCSLVHTDRDLTAVYCLHYINTTVKVIKLSHNTPMEAQEERGV
jgi:hypothetical protein